MWIYKIYKINSLIYCAHEGVHMLFCQNGLKPRKMVRVTKYWNIILAYNYNHKYTQNDVLSCYVVSHIMLHFRSEETGVVFGIFKNVNVPIPFCISTNTCVAYNKSLQLAIKHSITDWCINRQFIITHYGIEIHMHCTNVPPSHLK